MSWNSPVIDDRDFSSLTFMDKFSLAFALTRSYGVKVLGAVLGISLGVGLLVGLFVVLFAGAASTSGGSFDSFGPIAVLLTLVLVLVALVVMLLVLPMLGIGLKYMVLHYVNGEEPEGGLMGALGAPWSRLGLFVLCMLLLFAVNMAVQMVLSILGIIPFLNILLVPPLYILYYMFYNCSVTYMADRGLYRGDMTDPTHAIAGPLKIIKNNFKIWICSYLAMMAIYLPSLILVVVGSIFMNSSAALGLIVMLAGIILVLPVSVFDLFFMTVTYKQTSIIEENTNGAGNLPRVFE
ncbi:hypothetical protein LJB99_06520, partial [Deltaproteobacteria bacterium OttesenSCG-928-K17]|nr:hypothetical protein [Deltaproteobacteria bacterium OttesenSCG-928-K17]